LEELDTPVREPVSSLAISVAFEADTANQTRGGFELFKTAQESRQASADSLGISPNLISKAIQQPWPNHIVQLVTRYVNLNKSAHVRFTPKSGHSSERVACPLCAKSGHPFALSRTDFADWFAKFWQD
jgi:hypothetical protein